MGQDAGGADVARRWSCVVIAGSLFASGCGLVSDEATANNESAAARLANEEPDHIFRLQAPDETGEGCDDLFAVTDPELSATDRRVARCAAGYPVAQPLESSVELRVAIREPHEELAPLLLADHFGELAEENIDIELVETEDLREAYRMLGHGEVDVVVGDYQAGFFDMVVAGDGARVVMGGAVSAAAGYTSVPQAGLWMSHHAVTIPGRWIEFEDQPILMPDGIFGASTVPVHQVLTQGDASLNDLAVIRTGGGFSAEALLAGEVKLAWLDDPHWQRVASQEEFALLTTRPREALGGVVVHERLADADADRDVGLAFVRALIRTINTYLADPDDYRADGEIIAALTELTGWSDEELAAGPGFVFDWELRDETLERMQGPLVASGAVLYPAAQEDDMFADTSLYLDAVAE